MLFYVACGIALYLLGDVLFRSTVHIPSSRVRLGMALLSLPTIALGVWLGGFVQVGALLVVFVIILSWEHATAKSPSQATAVEQQRRDSREAH